MGDEVTTSNGILFLLLLLISSLVGGNYLRSRPSCWFQPSGLATLLGIIFGAFFIMIGQFSSFKPVTQLNADFLFLFLLPPIIFESGYNMETHAFFKQFGSSLAFAFLGTFISAIIIGTVIFLLGLIGATYSLSLAESFIFGSLISSTDTVSVLAIMKDLGMDASLYNVIFGESIFNDAVTIVLYQTILRVNKSDMSWKIFFEAVGQFFLIFIGSFLIGSLVAMLVSYILRRINNKNRINLEASAVIFGPWIAYLLSEALNLSGIVSILFCGIIMARYTQPNLSEITRAVVGRAYSAVSEAFETLVFIFIGMGLFSFKIPYDSLDPALCIIIIILIPASRGAQIMACSKLINPWRTHPINSTEQIVMWFSGLRGGIAFALAIQTLDIFINGDIILTLTLIYSLLSILIGGTLIKPLIKRTHLDSARSPFDKDSESQTGKITCCNSGKQMLLYLDEKYLYPFLVREKEGSGYMSPHFTSPRGSDISGIQLPKMGSNGVNGTHDLEAQAIDTMMGCKAEESCIGLQQI